MSNYAEVAASLNRLWRHIPPAGRPEFDELRRAIDEGYRKLRVAELTSEIEAGSTRAELNFGLKPERAPLYRDDEFAGVVDAATLDRLEAEVTLGDGPGPIPDTLAIGDRVEFDGPGRAVSGRLASVEGWVATVEDDGGTVWDVYASILRPAKETTR